MTTTRFDGTIPRHYEDGLGPLLFDWSAEELARRVEAPAGGRVLETACGTGISTEALRGALGPSVEIVATDLNPAMLAIAAEERGRLPGVSFRQADAQALPFDDGSFDAVVCPFGLMFFPDRGAALSEAARVLAPGGLLALSVWDSLEANPPVRVAQEAIAGCFPDDPPRFLEVPFGLHDEAVLLGLLDEAGFVDADLDWVERQTEVPSARGPAEGFVRGNPNVHAIRERGGTDPEVVVTAVQRALAEAFGDAPMRASLRAAFVSARVPGC